MKGRTVEFEPEGKKVSYSEGELGRTEDEAMAAALSGLNPSERKALKKVGQRLADRLNEEAVKNRRILRGLGSETAIEIFTKALMLDSLAETQPEALKKLGVDISARVDKK